MKELKHTAGPWEAKRQKSSAGDMVINVAMRNIAEHVYNPHDTRLIASAPEMLEYLINELVYLVGHGKDISLKDDPLITLIEKATGEKIEDLI
jgi:hypothetical protein